ncbi:MAG: hypothetical protein WD604_00380 [Balneolaceae bacterium]
MPLIDRSDLQFDYTWSSKPGNNPRNNPQTGGDTKSSLFRRNEGDEVLSLINEYAKDHEITNKREALRIEGLLREKLGEEDMTREEVKVWMDDLMRNREGTGSV